jgi:predicted ribosome quality control (RQC) complex YloA/Tae2 family protein
LETQRKVSLSGLEVRVLVGELAPLVGSYVSNIHALGEAQLFRLRKGGGEEASMMVSPRFGAWVTEKPAYTETADFTSSLRGALLRSKLEGVSQYDLDRVVFFRFIADGKPVQLVLELIPPGNIILTDESGRVVLSLREAKGPQRTVARGRVYLPPPQSRGSPDKITVQSLLESFAREKTAGKALGKGISLPRKYIDEILARASLQQDDPATVPEKKVEEIVGIIKKILSDVATPTPSLVEKDGRFEIMPIAPVVGKVVETTPTMSKLMDIVFTPLLLEEENQPEEKEDQEARELEVTLERLVKQVEVLKEKAAALRQLALAVRGSASVDEAKVLVAGAAVGPEIEGELADVDSTASISSGLFDEAKRCEAETVRIGEVEDQVRARLRRAKKSVPKQKVRVVERGKKEWYEKFRWFYTTEGRLAIGGRDAQSNTLLVKKHAVEGDIVFHADLFGSPFFILKGGNGQSAEEIRQVAQATAAFSSAWKTGLAAADAYWVEPEQVSNTAPSGEYLAKGSFAIRGKKNFVNKNPVEVAVGVDAAGRIVAGPEEAIMKQSRAHITLIPQREKASDTAKKVLFELKKFFADEMEGVSLDDVMRAIPSGGGKIVRRRENWKRPSEGTGLAQGEGEETPAAPEPSL